MLVCSLAAGFQIPEIWRRRRDSNPRDPFESNGFQDRRFQPLTHSSDFNSSVFCELTANLLRRQLGFYFSLLVYFLLLVGVPSITTSVWPTASLGPSSSPADFPVQLR